MTKRPGRLIAAAVWMAGACAALAGCRPSARSILSPAAPASEILARLGWPVLIGFTAVSAVMAALIVWLSLRHRGTFAEHAPVSAGGGMSWVVVGGFIIPGIAFTAIFVATIGTLSAFPMGGHEQPPAEIRVVAHRWWWEVEYLMGDQPEHFTTANEIHLPTDRPVEIELESHDVIHSFWVPRLQGKVDLIPGLENHIRLEAPLAGTYFGACAEFCGLQHAHMRFVVVAQAPAEFEAWLAQQRKAAAPPASPQTLRGEATFMNGPCPVCHTIAGTGALATVGPNLTHLASRQTLAAGWLPKDLATLHAWLVNAPSLKPGVEMPALTQLNGPELHDLVAYLEGLQ